MALADGIVEKSGLALAKKGGRHYAKAGFVNLLLPSAKANGNGKNMFEIIFKMLLTMNRILLIVLLLLFTKISFAQSPKDTMVTNVPNVNGRILYTDSLIVKGRSKHILDSIAQNWYISYFFHRLPEKDTLNSIYGRGLLEYKVKPGMINIDYEAAITVQITCKDGWYKYQLYDIKFRPKSGVLNDVGYQNDPEYLIKIYKQKHLTFAQAYVVSRSQIRDYISKMNKAVHECIASLNKTMAN